MKKVSLPVRKISVWSDIYYRISALPLIFQLWVIIKIWEYRLWKYQGNGERMRARLDGIWYTCEQLKGEVREEHETKLRQLERDYIFEERRFYDYEEKYFIQKELFSRYWEKIIDPHFG